jgi:hypothetical protein
MLKHQERIEKLEVHPDLEAGDPGISEGHFDATEYQGQLGRGV